MAPIMQAPLQGSAAQNIKLEGAGYRLPVVAQRTALERARDTVSPKSRQKSRAMRQQMSQTTFPIATYEIAGFQFKVKHNPWAAHVGNVFVCGVGAYKESESNSIDVLNIINKVTKKAAANEKMFAQVMLNNIVARTAISSEQLEEAGLGQADEKLLKQINRLILLISLFEITRRGFSECTIKNAAGKENVIPARPFAICFVKSLMLLINGHVRMEQVFGEDAQYGVSTTRKLNTLEGIAASFEKFDNLNALYVEKIYLPTLNAREAIHYAALKQRFPAGQMVARSEVLHQELGEIYGRVGSPGARYETPATKRTLTMLRDSERDTLNDFSLGMDPLEDSDSLDSAPKKPRGS